MHDVSDVRAVALLGVLRSEQCTVKVQGEPLSNETRGHWEVSTYEHCVQWRCLCGRSDPLLLTHKEHDRVALPLDGIHSCEICREEIQCARTKNQRLLAWIEQHRSILREDACLELPTDLQDNSTLVRDRLSRTRRMIFTKFWRKPVTSEHCVHLTCDNPLCINPYHLCLTQTPASKLPTETLKEVHELLRIGLSCKGIQNHLQERHCTEFSLRSIQRIAREKSKPKS